MTVVLVACSKSKAPAAARARDLYTGGLFRLSVRYAESRGLPWAVLSAKHGLLDPDQVVEPYSHSFSKSAREDKADEGYRREWSAKVGAQLRERFPGAKFVSLAVFAHGCFWHGCPAHFRAPKTRAEHWAAHIAKNRARDERVRRSLRRLGYRTSAVWEHYLKTPGGAASAAARVVSRAARKESLKCSR